jgi:hypothetical protein
MWIGYLKYAKEKVENINWVTDYVKCLGIYFGHNKAECKNINIEKQALKFHCFSFYLFSIIIPYKFVDHGFKF